MYVGSVGGWWRGLRQFPVKVYPAFCSRDVGIHNPNYLDSTSLEKKYVRTIRLSLTADHAGANHL